jgi:FkbM family methyltransferase
LAIAFYRVKFHGIILAYLACLRYIADHTINAIGAQQAQSNKLTMNVLNMNNALDKSGKFNLLRLADTELRAENLKLINDLVEYSYLGDFNAVCKILGRFYCYIDTRDRKICGHLLTKGIWEVQNTECIVRHLKPGMSAIDVGANYGYFTLLMNGLVGHGAAKVYAIEANPMLCQLLQDSLEVNGMAGKTELINCAVYKEPIEQLEFTFGNNRTNNGRLSVCKNNPDNMREGERVVQVPGNTLDHLIPTDQKIDFIKVDIEGAEEMFWYGSRRIREDNDELKILMEFNPRSYADPVKLVKDVFAEGYQVKRIMKSPQHDQILNQNELLTVPKNEHIMLLMGKNLNN